MDVYPQIDHEDAASRFDEVNRLGMNGPVIITEQGQPRTVLIPFKLFERFLTNERIVFLAKDTPPEFVDQLVARANGIRAEW